MTFEIGEASASREAKTLGRHFSFAFRYNRKGEPQIVFFKIVTSPRKSWKVKAVTNPVWRKLKGNDLAFHAVKCGVV
jgi:hypothetical protein